MDIIDPTDTLDLLLPSPTYPFTVQASALHEWACRTLLADRLLARSPGVSPPSVEND
jgi:hypothetical protein